MSLTVCVIACGLWFYAGYKTGLKAWKKLSFKEVKDCILKGEPWEF